MIVEKILEMDEVRFLMDFKQCVPLTYITVSLVLLRSTAACTSFTILLP